MDVFLPFSYSCHQFYQLISTSYYVTHSNYFFIIIIIVWQPILKYKSLVIMCKRVSSMSLIIGKFTLNRTVIHTHFLTGGPTFIPALFSPGLFSSQWDRCCVFSTSSRCLKLCRAISVDRTIKEGKCSELLFPVRQPTCYLFIVIRWEQ